jgi:DNA-binding NtrC family response regulator
MGKEAPDSSEGLATMPLAAAAPRPPLAIRVRVSGAAADPCDLELTSGSCVVGTARAADLVIEDASVSRRHVELRLVPEGVEVVDLGSRNGTFYLGQRVQRMVLAPGSRIRVGAVEVHLDADLRDLDAEGAGDVTSYRGIVGRSPAMRRLFATLARLEGSLVPVLIEGESGVGKELVARAIRDGSALATRSYVVVNCGAIARELVLSELFGHKRGAFTGAVDDRRGAFEQANGGTMFLDEIGELPLDVQPTLLRTLELGELRPLGDTRDVHVRVRVIAATNRDLEEEVRAGRFRQDLFYRLAVVRLHVPPLRNRLEDIELLGRTFANQEGAPELPRELLADFAANPWPGNVRELKNAVLSFLALGEQRTPPSVSDALDTFLSNIATLERPYADQKDEIVERFTRAYLKQLLERTGGNQTDAARVAGLDRGYLGKLIARHMRR